MLTKFSVSHYKNFASKIEFDLSHPAYYEFNGEVIRGGIITKGLIYGANGSGKSNLCLAMFDITKHLTDNQRLPDVKYISYLNYDSPSRFAEFEYEFLFYKKRLVYRYQKDENENLIFETLLIDGSEVVKYDFTKQEGFTKLRGTEKMNLSSAVSNISRVKYVKSNAILSKNDIRCAVFLAFVDFIDNMLLFYSLRETGYQGFRLGGENFTQAIVGNNRTKDFEDFLRECGIDYNLVEGEYNQHTDLFCHFDDTGKDVLFTYVASTGTMSLALFYYWYIMFDGHASLVLIDEFDAFYHYRLAKSIVERLNKISGTQIFLTTHNTDLLSNNLLRPDCYFVIQNGSINSLHNLTDKDIRHAHNIQKMFKAGVFDE